MPGIVTERDRFSWAAYWAAHTNLWLKGRDGLIIPDDYGNDAKILPSCFRGNASGRYRYIAGGLFNSNDWILNLDVVFNNCTTNNYFIGQEGFRFGLLKASNIWRLILSDGVNNRSFDVALATLPLTNRKYSFKLVHDQDGSTTLYESDVQVGTASGTFTNIANGGNFFGCAKDDPENRIANTVYLISSSLYTDMAETTLKFKYVFTGQIGGEWDLSGNGYNLSNSAIIAANMGYTEFGSSYLLNSGWALWQKAANPDIYVPSGGITTAPSTGYTLTKNYEGSLTKINMAPCLIGFNETGSAATALEIFDRSNTTRQTAASRASAYYDATSLATKSRYHISEIYSHEVFTTLFETDYQDTVFTSISKTGSDFSINAFRVVKTQLTGKYLTQMKVECQIDGLITVGTDKNVSTINQAITRAYDDYTITIDTGTYNEFLDFTVKTLNLVGLGSLETIIHYSIESASSVSTINIAKDCIFKNLIIDKREGFLGAAKPIVNISACNPVFTNCQIGRTTYVDGYNSQKPMTIANDSVVNMTGCSIKGTVVNGTLPYDLLVTDTSILNFEGTSFFACLRLQDTAEAIIDTDILWTNGSSSNNPGIVCEDDSIAYITVNIGEKYFSLITKAEYAAGIYCASSFRLYDNANLILSGNQITGGIPITGAGVVCLFKNIVSTLGRFWLNTGGAAATAVITFDNCQIVMDANDDLTGSHIIEETVGAEVRIINGSVLEFSGHNGNWFTMGNPITCSGKLYIRDSEIIDNVNDNIPAGPNYASAILIWDLLDIENSIITNQNWDAVGVNRCINFQKTAHININIKNVVLNNSEINTSPIHFQGNEAGLDADDYICQENITNNTTQFILNVDTGVPATTWATLIGNCPT